MAKTQAAISSQLTDFLMSEEEMLNSEISHEYLFEVKDSHEISIGFSEVTSLKAHIYTYEEESSGLMVRNVDGADWITVFEHPLFQRRRPQIVSNVNLQTDEGQEYFVLVHGQKTGPYEKSEMLSLLELKKILLTDMVSINSGHTWTKLYLIDNFDRRVLKDSDKLPGVPEGAVMHVSESVSIHNPETEAISSLAYLSNIKKGKSVEKDKIQIYGSDKNIIQSSSSLYKLILLASIVGIGYFLFHIKNQLSSPFTAQQPTIGEQAQMLTPVDTTNSTAPKNTVNKVGESHRSNQINDQRRSGGKFETRALKPIVPKGKKSFMETKNYQEIKETPEAAEDQNYYYDNTSAMELDPVRSQVSKENFDNSRTEGEGPIPSSDNLFESEVSN